MRYHGLKRLGISGAALIALGAIAALSGCHNGHHPAEQPLPPPPPPPPTTGGHPVIK